MDALKLLTGVRMIQTVRDRIPPSSPAELARRLDPTFVVTPTIRLLSDIAVRSVVEPNQRDIANAPPRTGKSEMMAVWTPVWALSRNPDMQVGIICNGDELAQEHSRKVRDIIREHSAFLGFSIAADKTAVGRWRVQGHKGGLLAAGINSHIVGYGFDLLLMDDVVGGAAEADSAAHRARVLKEYQGSLSTRIHPGGSIVLLMTRWNPADLAGELLRLQPGRWRHTNIPAVSDLRVPDALGRTKPGVAMVSALGFTPEDFEEKRQTVGERMWYCTPAETPILMADYTEKPICKVVEGDRVMGFTHGGTDADGSKYPLRFQPTTVLHAGQVGDDVVNELVTESGNRVRCTADHRWFTGRFGAECGGKYRREPYRPAVEGSKLHRYDVDLPPLTPERQRLLDYLAGIIDGEGHVAESSLVIAQSPDANPETFNRIGGVLDALGFSYKLRIQTPRSFKPNWSRQGLYVLRKPRAVYTEIVRRTWCAKAAKMVAMMDKFPSYPRKYSDPVLRIIPGLDPEPVYALQTETGNYVAWGYASSNSQYMGSPTTPSGGLVKSAWLDDHRLAAAPQSPVFTVVAIDPSDSGEGDSCGVVAVSRTAAGKCALIADRSAPMTSDRWASVAVDLAIEVGASEIVVEGFAARETYIRVLREALKRARESGKLRRDIKVSAWPPKGRSRVGDAIARSASLLQDLEVGRMVLAGHHPEFEQKATGWQAGQHQPDSLAALVIGHDVAVRSAGMQWDLASPLATSKSQQPAPEHGSVTSMEWFRQRVG